MASVKITQNIGTIMPHGMAGSYARQPDMIVNTFAAGGACPFGAPLVLADGKVVLFTADSTAADFVGIAAREFKSALTFLDQGEGFYDENEAASVFQRGCINVICQKGTPAYGGSVYIRIAENASYPTAIVGGFEAEADDTNTVEIPFCKWMGPADANGVAELRVTTFPNTGLLGA